MVKISEELAAFRDRVPGCQVVLFADFSTGMVLASSTAEKTTQEKLDALCMQGRAALNDPLALSLAAICDDTDGTAADFAMCADDLSVSCYLRAPAPAQEALCFSIDAPTLSDQVFEDASSLLRRISMESA